VPVDALSRFLGHEKIRRVLALGFFVATLFFLRHLATLFVFYVILAHALAFVVDKLAGWTRIKAKIWVIFLVVSLAAGAGILAYSGVLKSIPAASRFLTDAKAKATEFKESAVYKSLEALQIEPEKFGDNLKKLGGRVFRSIRATGRALLHFVIALILAVLFIFEREEIDPLLKGVPPDSFSGYLVSFFSYLSEAVVLTVKVQVVVALVNAVVTLPVILALGLPHVWTLMLLVFVLGLVPVVGNFISGIILGILSYMSKGWIGVLIFFISTSALHKVESYYLNPRLVARHVKLPSLMLIFSLIIWEQLIGLAGIFISFPALYVGLRIRDRFKDLAANGEPAESEEQQKAAEEEV